MSRLAKAVVLLMSCAGLLLSATNANAVTTSFTLSGTWTAPAGVTSVTVEAWGAGGGGGAATGNPAKGGGGAGGQYASKVITVVPGNPYAVVVGAGATGSTGDGATGGDSTFNGTSVVAKGGAGGTGATNGVAGVGSATGGVGTTVFAGGSGSAGVVTGGGCQNGGAGGGGAGSGGAGGNAAGNTAGTGTATGGGNGGAGGNTSGNGSAGSVAGGGGGGACAETNTNRNGGNGANGTVSISYIPPPTVTSINTASTNPTAPATAVAWTVVFSASVTGVDATDFVLVQAGGVTGATITSVTGAGTTWTVNANTGSGTGTLGLNLVDNDTIVNASIIPLGGVGAGNGNFTGQVYTVPAPFCSPPSNIPAGVTVTCQCDTFQRATLNPSTIFGGNWQTTTSGSTSFLPQIVNPGYMRLTSNTGNEATAATVPGIFPAAGNYISVEFLQYAYNGTGADGIAVTLSDYSVPAAPGAFGGSLGYAQKASINGFAGGWIGVALDEFGNYQNATEGRVTGPGSIPQSVSVRGSGSGVTGYPWLKGTANLTTVAPNVGIANSASTTPSYGDYYQVIVDSRGNNGVSGPALVSVNRDITGVGNAYSPLISSFDAYTAATAAGYVQAPVPQNWQVSFTGSTGASYNIHEIGGLRICAQTMVPTTGGTPGGFNAIDEVYMRNDVNATSGHLYTKLAGVAFTVKVAALNATGTGILSTYALSGNKIVTVNLFDDSVGASCNSSAAACSACNSKPLVATQNMTFVSGDTGFKQSGNFTVPAYANLIAQMTDGTTTGCSVDAFAVRPSGIASVTSSNATNTATSGTPIFKAGSDNFLLTATTTTIAGNPSGYTGGVPKINANGVQAFSPATVAGAVAGSFAAATSGASSATATGITFTYSEVGAFNLLGPDFTLTPTRIPGVYDDAWTIVDSGAKNDCVSGTTAAAYSNTKNANGKYGCNFGISANTGAFGRFVPDHFDTVVTPGMPCPTGLTCPTLFVANDQGFVYSGQPLSLTVTAKNAGGGTTANYNTTTGFAKTTNLTAFGVLGTTTAPTGAGVLGVANVTAFAAGTLTEAAEKYTFTATPTAPADIYLRATDSDAVTSLRSVPASSVEGGVKVVSGRVTIANVYGSELLPLTLIPTAQYYDATSNWVTSLTDSVTKLMSLPLPASYPVGTTGTTSATFTPSTGTISGGVMSINLAKPTGGVGKATVTPTAPPSYLPFTSGTATFGVYGGSTLFVYRGRHGR